LSTENYVLWIWSVTGLSLDLNFTGQTELLFQNVGMPCQTQSMPPFLTLNFYCTEKKE